jgi:lincosamide nucleotidyltransferase A/C/D/E
MDQQDSQEHGELPAMSAQDAIALVRLIEAHGITVWVDGGWGVDALLGAQTRPHRDLDIAISHHDVPGLRAILESRGFTDVPRDDTRDSNFVIGDDRGLQVDVHSFLFDADGRNIYGCAYPAESLTGAGTIDGQAVRCISPEWIVRFHTGYAVDSDDYRDVRAICSRFGIAIPADYAPFMQRDDP